MTQEIKLIVGIPTINRADLLNDALRDYFEDFKDTEIVICDNGKQDIITREKNFFIYRPQENLGVAKSWNMLMDYADKVGASHVLILNDDIYLGKTQEQILALIKVWRKAPFINSQLNWCAFIFSVNGFKKVGQFDESFGNCYFEDNDMFYRMSLLKMQMVYTEFLNPVTYRNSMTIERDPSLNNAFLKNKEYFIRKWGGEPHYETFTTPFNQ